MKHEDANPALWTSSVVPAWIPVAYAVAGAALIALSTVRERREA